MEGHCRCYERNSINQKAQYSADTLGQLNLQPDNISNQLVL